jgi:uncharacterized protein
MHTMSLEVKYTQMQNTINEDKMKIVIAGGTGFLGQALTTHFLTHGHEITIIGRDRNKIKQIYGNQVTPFNWELLDREGKKLISLSNLIINLAGVNIAENRWTKKRKQEIIESRLLTTRRLAEICALFGKNSPPLFNASAVGIYGLQKPTPQGLPPPYDEDTHIDFNKYHDFVSQIVKTWERATHLARAQGVRVVNMRFAMILDKKGLLAKLKPIFLSGLGGPIGSGNQPFPWIALPDVIAAIDFLYDHPTLSGPINFISPTSISQKQFAKAFARILHRPSFLRIPAFFLKIIFGEMGNALLLNGQCAYPKVLLSNDFNFSYTDIDKTLEQIFK